MKLTVAKESIFFGPGPQNLLQTIEKTGSVRHACSQLKMSYSKGWKLIRKIEDNLGFEVISRKQGGKEGGGAELTPKGKDFLLRYNQFEKELKKEGQTLFEHCFEGFSLGKSMV